MGKGTNGGVERRGKHAWERKRGAQPAQEAAYEARMAHMSKEKSTHPTVWEMPRPLKPPSRGA